MTFDNTPGSEVGVLLCFIEADFAIENGSLDEGRADGLPVELLTPAFGDQAAEPIEYLDVGRGAKSWSRGARQILRTGLLSLGRYLREPEGRILWPEFETSPVVDVLRGRGVELWCPCGRRGAARR